MHDHLSADAGVEFVREAIELSIWEHATHAQTIIEENERQKEIIEELQKKLADKDRVISNFREALREYRKQEPSDVW